MLSCVDNYAARVTINKACCQADQIWMNSGVAENATSGQIQTCIPGITGCFLCAPPYIVAMKGDESTIKRPDVCTASLPTTMGVVAGLLAHNALKYLLGFGTVTKVLTYNSLQDFFPSYLIGCNPECTEKACIQRQDDKEAERAKVAADATLADSQINDEPVEHTENEYEITLLSDETVVEHTRPSRQAATTHQSHVATEKLSLKELRDRLKQVSTNADNS